MISYSVFLKHIFSFSAIGRRDQKVIFYFILRHCFSFSGHDKNWISSFVLKNY